MNSVTNNIIEISNMSFGYSNKTILENISFQLKKGEIAVFLGKSGVGKTTFIKLIAGLEHPDVGEIRKFGISLSDDDFFIPPNKRNIAVVFQEDSLFPHLNIFENIKLANKNVSREEIQNYFKIFQLEINVNQFPHQLSGGQKQRVATIRALIQNPDCILFDEPFSALDYHLREKLRRKLRSILKDNGTSAIFITHDIDEALIMADKVHVMHKQRIIQSGTVSDILKNPLNKFVAKFLGSGLVIPGDVINSVYKTEQSTNKSYFIPFKDFQIDNSDSIIGIEAYITDKNFSSGNYYEYYFHLVESDHEFGPVTSSRDLSINDKFKIILPSTMQQLKELAD